MIRKVNEMRHLAAFLLLVAVAAGGRGQTTYESTLDLSEGVDDSVSVPAGSKVLVHVVNLAPGNEYNFTYEQYTTDPSPIDTSGSFKQEAAKQDPDKKPLTFLGLDTAVSLETERDEKKIPDLVAALRTLEGGLNSQLGALNSATDDANIRDINAALAAIDALIGKTRRDFLIDVALAAKQGVIFKVRRSSGPDSPKTWRRNFHVGGPGNFVSNYVFAFAPQGDKRYFSAPEGTKFKITEEVRRDKVGYVPLVLFSWIPNSKGNEPHISSITAGLGYDLSNLVVAAGYLYTYNRNIGFTIGGLAQKQQRLKGRLHTNQVIDTAIDSKDLTDAVWRPNVYIGISIRSVTAMFR